MTLQTLLSPTAYRQLQIERMKRRAVAPNTSQLVNPYNFQAYGGVAELMDCLDDEWITEGPAECVAGETRILDAITGEGITIKELYDQGKAIMVQTLAGIVKASNPFLKGKANLFRVVSESGQYFTATGKHLVMTARGWTYVDSLRPGELLIEYSPYHVRSSAEPAPLLCHANDQHLKHKSLDFRGHYSEGCHQHDGLAHLGAMGDQASVQQPSDAHARIHDNWLRDDPASLSEHNPFYQWSFRPSSGDLMTRSLSWSRGCVEYPLAVYTFSHDDDWYEPTEQWQLGLLLHRSSEQPDHDFDYRRLFVLSAIQSPGISSIFPPFEYSNRDCRLPGAYSLPVQIHPRYSSFVHSLNACSLSFVSSCNVCKSYYKVQPSKVSSVTFMRFDDYYDLTVPGIGHYFADGFIHHNTGKTMGALNKLHQAACQHPKLQILIARKTQASMAGSVLKSYQKKVLPPGDIVKVYGGIHPELYVYPNGTEVRVGGLDNPDKILSSEYDIVYVNQAEELSLADWEVLGTRTTGRASSYPNPMIFGDCNPGPPSHWIMQRKQKGMLVIPTTHRDNPTLFDHIAKAWTPQGERTLARLSRMTGSRLLRLYHGLWAQPEGAIYDIYQEEKHKIKAFDPPISWPRIVGVDPVGVYTGALWLAFDPATSIIHAYREYYAPFGKTTSGHVQEILKLSQGETIFAWVGAAIAERQARADWIAAGVPLLEPPFADVWSGIDRVYELLRDFRLVIHDCCENLLSEIGDYKRKLKDGAPTDAIENKEAYHMLDALRYPVAWLTTPSDEQHVTYMPVQIGPNY